MSHVKLESKIQDSRSVQAVTIQIKLNDKIEFVNNALHEVDLSNIHTILRSSTQYTISTGGQRLRPIICMLCAEIMGSNFGIARDTFIALELIHNATLVHDDIIDEDQFRRGVLSVPRKFGARKAVLTGDTLFSLGLMYASKTGKPEVIKQLSETTLKMIQGISLQSFNKGKILTEEEFLNLNYLKSGSLFEAAAVLGGMMGSYDEDSLLKLAEFGRYFGNAYQIRDDICDAFLEDGSNYKAKNDLLNGDSSLLFIYSLKSEKIQENKKSELISIYKGQTNQFDLDKIRKIYQDSEALEKSINKMKKFALKARESLDFFNDSEAKSSLINLMNEYYIEFSSDDLRRDLV
jgi:geranylgeranyl pyrophosphate synthase